MRNKLTVIVTDAPAGVRTAKATRLTCESRWWLSGVDGYNERSRQWLNHEFIIIVALRVRQKPHAVQATHAGRHLVRVRRKSTFQQRRTHPVAWRIRYIGIKGGRLEGSLMCPFARNFCSNVMQNNGLLCKIFTCFKMHPVNRRQRRPPHPALRSPLHISHAEGRRTWGLYQDFSLPRLLTSFKELGSAAMGLRPARMHDVIVSNSLD